MRGSGIYKIQSKIKPKRFYIGSTACLRDRWLRHKRDLRGDKHHSVKLQRHVNKYGFDDLVFSVLELCLPDALIDREQYYLDKLKPYFNLYPTAGSCRGAKRGPMPVEVRLKISLAQRGKVGKKMTEEQRLKMIKAVTGLKRSEETKKRMSKWQKGKKRGPLPEKVRKKMSESHKGTKKPADVRKKMSESGKLGWIKRKLKQSA